MTSLMKSKCGTRSSNHWPAKPGSFDRLNIRYLFPSNNQWGIPNLDFTDIVPEKLIGWHDITGLKNNPDAFMHFFLDDYHFESIWNKPERSVDKVQIVSGALTPDFSVLTGMPKATQLYQVYRSCWVGCFWQSQGITVIPTAQWAEPDTFEWCFAGIPFGSTVAISALGIKQDEVAAFDIGLNELMKQKYPSHLLVYGELPGFVPYTHVVTYPTHWQRKRNGL